MRSSKFVLGLSSLVLTRAAINADATTADSGGALFYSSPFGGLCPADGSSTSSICPAYPLAATANQSTDGRRETYTTVDALNSPQSEPEAESSSPILQEQEQPPTSSQPESTSQQPPPSRSSDQDNQDPKSEGGEEKKPASPWSRGAVCRRVGKDEFCAFTHSAFNGGEGISLITTPATLLALGSQAPLGLPMNTTPEDTPKDAVSPTEPPYKDVAFPGKGIGLVSTEPLRALRRVMARTPALMVDDRAFRGLRKDDLSVLLAQAIVALPDQHRQRFLNLSSSHGESDSPTSQLDLVYKIFTTNAFRTPVKVKLLEETSQDLKDSVIDFQSTFTEVSRLNHDCSPNLGYYFDWMTLSHKVYAVRDIMPGEELTVGYVDVLQTRSTRHRLLQTTWHFSCTCQRCGGHSPDSDTHILEESDSRVSQINQLRRELDDYSASATPEKAELLVALYELEGAHVRLYEAHYRAALEWNGVGDAAKASRYARMCLANGLVLRGPDRPFVESMRALVADPTGHWSWRFRVNKNDAQKHAEGK
ncbi:hypothetical protein B0H66DRAFT_483401 [Apodospora peruviana]|uniref:SET domain-containing protein n=1 Tax=Apodospora peruviana TaxID=516989 RepID=A0AAE0HWI6_9PEZI|nr:hypothetical protein B0H66DRAFT_483401 [Apodospora peruviana]